MEIMIKNDDILFVGEPPGATDAEVLQEAGVQGGLHQDPARLHAAATRQVPGWARLGPSQLLVSGLLVLACSFLLARETF